MGDRSARSIIMGPSIWRRTGFSADFFVSHTGGTGTGSIDDPWSLPHALAGGGGAIAPGERGALRGGVYTGAFASSASLAGTPGGRITFMAYPGERPILDRASATGAGANAVGLEIESPYTDWIDIELTNSNTVRDNSDRPHGFILNADNVRLLDCIAHDCGRAGVYHYENRINNEIRGSLFYNNGYQEASRGNGHGLYVKSNVGPLLLRHIACFNNYGFGLHAYSDTGAGGLVGIRSERSTYFNTGSVSNQPTSSNSNILIGGQEPAVDCEATFNRLWFTPGYGSFNMRLGQDPANTMTYALIADNYIAGGSSVLDIGTWDDLDFLRNTIYGTARVVALAEAVVSDYGWTENAWYRLSTATAWRNNGTDRNFANWKTSTSLGGSDTNPGTVPTTNVVAVEAKEILTKRGMVTIYNWEDSSSVSADLSSILAPGDSYNIVSVQDLFGTPVASGTYGGGSVSIPMSAIVGPTPIGGANAPPASGPKFDCFIVKGG